jgi:protein-S-isoprenylcysteine O-methyltransferase Ste14
MYRYLICIGICAVIWIANARPLILKGIRKNIKSEFYTHIGLGIFFSLLTIELTLNIPEAWRAFDISWLRVVGFILYVPSAYFVVFSWISLKQKGRSKKSGDFTATTRLVDTGVYRIVRQPMTLGMAIWSIALILQFQSILSIILGLSSLFCFFMGARKEAERNIRKFGDKYREYMKRVPMWNFLKGGTEK